MIFLLIAGLLGMNGFSQTYNLDSSLASLKMKKDSTLAALKMQRDSTYHASIKTDSVKIGKEFAEKEKWEKLKSITTYPVLKAGDFSGVITVKDPAEVPDPNIEYKLLFN